MGFLDQFSSLLGGGANSQSPNIVGALLSGAAGAGGGGIAGVLETLAANGLAEHVASWTSGQGSPISPDQLQAALGNQQVQQLAQSSGLPIGDFLQHLAEHLPAAAAASNT